MEAIISFLKYGYKFYKIGVAMKSTANTSNHTIKATNQTIHSIVKDELQMLGLAADLNHIDVSEVTDMSFMFSNSKFTGDISKWKLKKRIFVSHIFSNSPITRENCTLDLSGFSEEEIEVMFAKSYD